MPLTPQNVTVASRVMLPVHVGLSTWIGLGWLLQDNGRTAVPALHALRNIWPIWATGTVLLVLAAVSIVGLLTHRRTLGGIALGMGALAYAALAVIVALPLLHGHGSYSAPAWVLYPAFAHFASMLSLATNERTVRA